MFKFHITGFAECNDPYYYDSNRPVDITVNAETQAEAITKAEKVLGYRIHSSGKRVTITEDVAPKSEVAREIFEEIEKLSHKFMNDQHYIFGDMLWDINELKKKYTEGKE